MTTAAHYRLTSDEFLTINSKLTDAQLRVYLYYKTLDPFGDRRIEICTKAIAETLGMTQRTVQLALNKLASLGLLIWERAKSFVTRNVDRLGEMRIAKAKSGSPRRNEDRERQLELSLEADSTTSHTSSNLFKLDHDLEQENFESIEDNNEISVDEALAEIRKALPDDELCKEHDELCKEHDELCKEHDELCKEHDELCKEHDELCKEHNESLDEDLHLNNEDEDSQEFEEILQPETGLQLNTVGNANGTSDGESFRRRVEDFILKTLGKAPKNRAAYFAKFDAKSWKKWEADYKASLVSPAPYKPYIPEKVEVAPPDSPVAQSAIAQIKAKLGIK